MWEISISEWFYNPKSVFTMIFELIGEAPVVIPFVYFAVVIGGIIAKKKYFLDRKWELIAFSVYLMSTVVVTSAVVTVIKNLWGRARFFEIAPPDYLGYTPFYQLSTFGGSSFPSGHASMSVFSILLYDINKTHKIFAKNNIIIAGSVIFTVLVCVSRLMSGAHFITDLLFGVGISLIIRWLLKIVHHKWFAKSLRDL